jgi:coenzyme F420-0:L-glutamate ligase/coenzyme F420-1:gamma-L-glutamate ligase
MPAELTIRPLAGLPMVEPGDDLAALTLAALADQQLSFQAGDILVVAQKVVSKAEGQLIKLDDVEPTARAIELAAETDKDPRLVQLILDESSDLLRKKPGVLIMRHRLGMVGAHAGIDQSNISHADGETALLLPEDPDTSAANLRVALREATGVELGVIIADSMNRPWRLGTIGCAIGCSGVTVLDDHVGGADLFGRELKVTLINRVDAIAATATLLMGETTERTPMALVRGFEPEDSPARASDLYRPLDEDLFR